MSEARATMGRVSMAGVGRSGCAAISVAGGRGTISFWPARTREWRCQIVRFGQIGTAHAQLARDGRQRLARLHGVPVQRRAVAAGESSSFSRSSSAVPAGTFSSYPDPAPASSSAAARD